MVDRKLFVGHINWIADAGARAVTARVASVHAYLEILKARLPVALPVDNDVVHDGSAS